MGDGNALASQRSIRDVAFEMTLVCSRLASDFVAEEIDRRKY